MKLKELFEMAQPRKADLEKDYYHGFSKESNLKGILEHGLQAPDLSNRKGYLRPVEGKVYITPHLEYGIIYCIGGDMAGHEMSKNTLKEDGKYGFLTVMDGQQLADLQPDEDSIGEMIHHKKFSWLNHLADYYLAANTIKKIMNGEYQYFAKAGKVLVKRLSDTEKLALIDAGAHIAHGGKLIPKEIWKFDKTLSKELNKDGSNFFKLAERIK